MMKQKKNISRREGRRETLRCADEMIKNKGEIVQCLKMNENTEQKMFVFNFTSRKL